MPVYIATEELKQLTINAIKSMLPSVFVLVVDDGSPLDTTFLDTLADYTLRLPKNSGFAIASNTGLAWLLDKDFEYIGCANNDIEVYDGWLDALLEPFAKFEDVGITGIIHSKDKQEAKTHKGRKITEGGLINDRMQNGGLWLSTKEVLTEVGLFDEQYEIGGEEDVDLFLRIRDTYGYKIVMSDKACFWHKEGATRWNDEVEPGFKAKNKAEEQKNYDRFATKWGFDLRTKGLNLYETVLED